jgi:hypothetical protein
MNSLQATIAVQIAIQTVQHPVWQIAWQERRQPGIVMTLIC